MGNIERQFNRRITIKATLEAQRRLKRKAIRKQSLGQYDPDSAVKSLAHVSRKFSRWSREIALLAGVKDARDINPKLITVYNVKSIVDAAVEGEKANNDKNLGSPIKRKRIEMETNIAIAMKQNGNVNNNSACESIENVNRKSIRRDDPLNNSFGLVSVIEVNHVSVNKLC